MRALCFRYVVPIFFLGKDGFHHDHLRDRPKSGAYLMSPRVGLEVVDDQLLDVRLRMPQFAAQFEVENPQQAVKNWDVQMQTDVNMYVYTYIHIYRYMNMITTHHPKQR